MSHEHPFHTYTREVMGFRIAGKSLPTPKTPDTVSLESMLRRALRLFNKSGKERLLFLGLGSGELVRQAARALSPGVLTVCDLEPTRTRSVLELDKSRNLKELKDGSLEDPAFPLLADISPWAHLLLLPRHGYTPDNTQTMLNPEVDKGALKNRLRALQRLFLSSSTRTISPGEASPRREAPSLSVAAILRPGEPELETFFHQIPTWAHEIVVVWDGEAPPGTHYETAAPLRQQARPLANDFAAQRNAMLAGCTGDWVLYLDGDEVLAPEVWNLLPELLDQQDLNGFWFPRRTLYPDEEHAMAGLGLWPDLQLRLFRNLRDLHFTEPIHERLQGFTGPVAVPLDAAILHYSHLRKNTEMLKDKLRGFDQAVREGYTHRLNSDYPNLPISFFVSGDKVGGEATLLVLESSPGRG